jgi:membrane protease YdiL (CAAX protease family)
MAILVSILASVAIGAITLFAARVVAPAWAATTNETATVVVAEVYAILIATLYWVFGGSKGAWSVLRVRPVPGRAFAIAFVAVAASIVLEDVGYLGVGAGNALVGSYLRLGTDGGRLGVIGPLTTTLSLGRACLLAPIGEELLFRGAVYGWSRRWLSARPAIVVNAVAWGALSAG